MMSLLIPLIALVALLLIGVHGTPHSPTNVVAVPQFVIRPQGPNFPAPSASEYEVANLADVQSAEFQESYNTTGGIILTGANMSMSPYCCLIRVADGGWLYYGAPPADYSPLSIFLLDTTFWSCSGFFNDMLHSLGTTFGGPQTGITFDAINATTRNRFGHFVNNTQDWDMCNNFTDTLTLFKRSH